MFLVLKIFLGISDILLNKKLIAYMSHISKFSAKHTIIPEDTAALFHPANFHFQVCFTIFSNCINETISCLELEIYKTCPLLDRHADSYCVSDPSSSK